MRLSEIIKDFALTVHRAKGEGQDPDPEILGVAALDKAGPGQLSFYSNAAFAALVPQSQASALLVREAVADFSGIQLIHKDPQFIFAKISFGLYRPNHGPLGIHESALIDSGASAGKDVTIHARVVVEEGASLGDGVVLYPGVYIGRGVQIGANTVLHPNVVVYHDCIIGARNLIHAGTVIGADGFGFSVSGGEICKIPQTGIVRIGNDVEIGALCTIDRAASGATIVHDFCKFDDRVHIAHNCEIGPHSMFSAQVGIAGSTKVGAWTLIGGQSGVADHLVLTDGVRIASKTAVLTNLPERGTYGGHPAIPITEWKRQVVYLKRLKDYDAKIKRLEQRLDDLEPRT